MSPDLVKFLADIQIVLADSSEVNFILEVDTEETGMVVSSLSFVAIFAASEMPEGPEVMAETLEEFLKVRLVEGPVWREFLVAVRECHEAVFLVELCFMGAPYTPYGSPS